MGGRLRPESVAGINRNRWPASPGIGGRNQAEYAGCHFELFCPTFYGKNGLELHQPTNQIGASQSPYVYMATVG